ncbi:MAG: DoxX family protein [Acidobacteria bacterium]|nr:DoxX family protein [Acidobacteriota bacterium]
MSQGRIASYEPYARSLLRIVAGLAFAQHGAQKILGLLGGMGGKGAKAVAFSQMWFAGVVELVGGVLILLGLFTLPAAFIASGEMAVAYFQVHWPQNFWPIVNRGELAVVYCFLFLYFFTAGPGPWSLDQLIRKKPSS